MKRGCLKRNCPFGAFCGEHTRRTVPRLSASRTSRRSDPEMPPRTRIPKAHKASRGAATPSRSANVPSTYPWPNKAEGQPININDPLLLDYNCERWDKESAARYNRLLAAEILPT
ncbi:hypothetical protein F2Q69_00023852 [Brassica cretica]|uniref:Uncharacterized protein n=1 Tax=Brassica cretica TaxID=69181 RepID=A0A8S9Q874_BRACR|nr:hypothetical protein F2Q69_00023852 [Brassica cretica]